MPESLAGNPPQWTVRKESIGNHRKYWIVRNYGKRISIFNTKSEAQGWVYHRERNGGYK